ncbi:hypothetical protein [Polaribacter sp.]|uniref:hypothetical protein n=1 Tax=Polaribacter sp. TaxID=1920175 RepID=UPI003F6D7A1D
MEHILPKIVMTEANEEILICRGILTLKNQESEIYVDGEIVYKWFPSIGVRFSGLLIW